MNKSQTPLRRLLENAGLVLLVGLFILPFVWMVITSLKTPAETVTYPPIFIPSEFRLQNFVDAWGSGPFLTYIKNSAVITLVTMVLQALFIIPAAYAFARYRFKGKNFFFGIVLITLMIPMQLVFIPLYLLFSKLGWINHYPSLIVPFASSAFGIFMLRQTFMSIPESLVSAAKLDNANEWTIIKKIMLPIARPTIVTVLLLTFISRWNDYFWRMVMTTEASIRPLSVGVANIAQTEGATAWNVVMAGNIILVLPILILYIIAQRRIINGFVSTEDK